MTVVFSLLRQRGPGAGARGGDPALQHAVLPLRPEDAPRSPRQGHQVRPSRRAGTAPGFPLHHAPPATPRAAAAARQGSQGAVQASLLTWAS